MNSKNNINNPENKNLTANHENGSEISKSGIYLRDDHCDWGSSGMNEFTNEYSDSN